MSIFADGFFILSQTSSDAETAVKATFALSTDSIRTWLHLIAIFVWVGGQITLGLLVPVLRKMGSDAPGQVARRFNRFAWPFFALAVLTGLWGMGSEWADSQTSWKVWLFIKVGVVALTGYTAWQHTQAAKQADPDKAKASRAVFGAATLLLSLFAALLGVGLGAVG